MRPTARMIFGFSSAICVRGYGRQRDTSSGFGIAIARRPALEDVGDEHGFARQADGQQHRVEQLAGAARRMARPGGLLRRPALRRSPAIRPGYCRRRTRSACASCTDRRPCRQPRVRAASPQSRGGQRRRARRGHARECAGNSAPARGTAGAATGVLGHDGSAGALRGTQRSMPSASRYALRSGLIGPASGGTRARGRRSLRTNHCTGP